MITAPVANIPIPPKQAVQIKYPLRDLEIGESFLVTVPEWGVKAKFQAAAMQAARCVKGKKFTSRQVAEGIRVWRTD